VKYISLDVKYISLDVKYISLDVKYISLDVSHDASLLPVHNRNKMPPLSG